MGSSRSQKCYLRQLFILLGLLQRFNRSAVYIYLSRLLPFPWDDDHACTWNEHLLSALHITRRKTMAQYLGKIKRCKNCENRLTLDKVITDCVTSCFLRTTVYKWFNPLVPKLFHDLPSKYVSLKRDHGHKWVNGYHTSVRPSACPNKA